MAANIVTKIIEMLKMAGIDYSKIAGKINPDKVKQLVTKTQKTATRPKLIDALNKDKATYGDALKIFEDEAQYISQMNEMELTNFANNLSDYFTVGGKKKNIPSNVVTTEGTPIVGKKLETLAARKGADVTTDSSLQGGLKGLMSLIDEIEGISPKMRNKMDRDKLAEFIQKMRGKKFTNEEIKWVREYMDDMSIGYAKEKATGMQFAKKLGAKDKDEFEFITEYVDNVNSYSPKEFKANYGSVKNVNMDISNIIDKKLEKHFKKKYKWDDTKKDGGLDDATYEKYDDELWDAQKEFGDFHTVYDSGPTNMFGMRKGKSWANHPNNYLDEASEKFERITGKGLNVDFFKKYTDDVLSKYPEPEKFQYGGPVIKGPDMGSTAHGSAELAARQRILQPGGQTTTSTGLNYLLGEDDNNRIPFNEGKEVKRSWIKFPSAYDEKGNIVPTFSKTGKQQIEGAPEGITSDKENINFIMSLDIPLTKKINLLGDLGYGKYRDKIEYGDDELFLQEGGGKSRKVGIGYNQEGEGFGGHIKYDMGTGKPEIYAKWSKEFNEGGRVPLRKGKTPKYKKDPIDWWELLGPEDDDPDVWFDILKSVGLREGGIARLGFGGGKLVDLSRRGFLKFVGGTAASIAALKSGLVKLMGGKNADEVKKVIDEVVIAKETGAPEWFQPLVNKILKEGKTVENITYGERQIGKVMDTPSGKVDVVYKLDTGEVELSFIGDKTALGEQVDLVYKPGLVDETTKGKKPPDQFIASESVPESHVTGPDDWSIDMGVNQTENVGDLTSDLTELKTFATGEKATIKEIVEGIKKKKVRETMDKDPGQYLTDVHGDYDPYASGGLAGMLGE